MADKMYNLDTDVCVDPIPAQRLTERAVERQPSGQGECKQMQREELVPSSYLMGSKRSGQRLHFRKAFKVTKLFSQIPR